jgi:carbon storage regulator CsrA
MLVVSRKEKQGITIDCNGEIIHIEITEIGNKQVKLGFEASREKVKILRDELLPNNKQN